MAWARLATIRLTDFLAPVHEHWHAFEPILLCALALPGWLRVQRIRVLLAALAGPQT
jgi:hypothetical protein